MAIPLQVISEDSVPPASYHDLSGVEPHRQEAKLKQLMQAAQEWPFDFEKGPLFYGSLVTLALDQHVLLMCLSALCADRTTIGNLVREISQLYEASLRKEVFPPIPVQYADVSEWQNELIEDAHTDIVKQYWRDRDMAALLTAKLAIERPTDAHTAFRPQSASLTIDPHWVSKLKAAVLTQQTSLAVFLLACWQTLLWRLMEQSDPGVGVVFDGRSAAGLEDALGPFGKSLPVHSHLQVGLPFSELLQRVHASILEVQAWQAYFS